jgi:hypothetical protein
MEGVEEVRRDGPNRLFWKARIGGQEKQWEAEITEQVPNARIVWRSVDGTSNRGAVTFEELDVSQTRVTLTMHYEPEGFFEQAGDALGIPLGEVPENLNRFREFIESGRETGAPAGQIDWVQTPFSTEQAMKEGDTRSSGESTEHEASSRDRGVPPAAIVTEAIASGIGTTEGGPIADEAEEPHQKHGTAIADTPQPMAIEGSSVEENTGTDCGNMRSLAPTHEQIARRAYELYLERGEKPCDACEDWLTAENELSKEARHKS